jgi:uncharacterized protein YwgA
MNRYQLAKIVDWAGTLHSRKRMQKVVYLLQAGGCPLMADYTLHHYGPYSHEVARLTDEMVRSKLLEESSESTPYGVQYAYRLSDSTKQQLDEYEESPQSRDWLGQMTPFEAKAQTLMRAELKDLEIAATVVFFRQQGLGWPEAAAKTRQFKNLPLGSPVLQRAEDLAKQIVS